MKCILFFVYYLRVAMYVLLAADLLSYKKEREREREGETSAHNVIDLESP